MPATTTKRDERLAGGTAVDARVRIVCRRRERELGRVIVYTGFTVDQHFHRVDTDISLGK